MADETIRILLDTQVKNAKQIDALQSEIKDLEKQVKSTGTTFKRVFETAIGVAVGQGLTGAVKLAGRGFKELVGFIGDGIQKAQVQEDAVNRLNQALAQSGKFTEETSQSLQEYASALQQSTTFGDEAILNAQALLQSLGRLDEDGLKQATSASLDLSAALGIDLQSAVTLVGKAAAGEISTFSRYGVIIEKGKDNTETFNNALKALNQQFGGAAAAQVQTFSGAVAQASNSFGDLQEELGFVVTQNASINSIIQESSKFFAELGEEVKANRAELQTLATQTLIFLVEGLDLAVAGVNKLVNAFFETRKTILGVQAAVADFTGAEDVATAIGEDINAIEEQQRSIQGVFDTTRQKIEEFQQRIAKAAEEGAKGQEALNEKLRQQSAAADAAAKANANLTAEQKKLGEAGLALAGQLGVEGVATPEQEAKARAEALQAQRDADLISEQDFLAQKQAILVEDFAARQAIIDEAESQGKLKKDQADAARLASEQKLTADIGKVRKQEVAFEKKTAEEKAAARKQGIAQIATLQSSGNKTLFRIGQAAALSEAIVDGIKAIQKTQGAFPFPFSIPFTAAVAAAQAANVAKIASAKPPGLQGGIDEVPPGFNNDTFPALLSSGERVVPSQTNQDLTRFLEGQTNTDALLGELISAVRESGNVQVNVGSETVTNVVRAELESGGTLAVEA